MRSLQLFFRVIVNRFYSRFEVEQSPERCSVPEKKLSKGRILIIVH